MLALKTLIILYCKDVQRSGATEHISTRDVSTLSVVSSLSVMSVHAEQCCESGASWIRTFFLDTDPAKLKEIYN